MAPNFLILNFKRCLSLAKLRDDIKITKQISYFCRFYFHAFRILSNTQAIKNYIIKAAYYLRLFAAYIAFEISQPQRFVISQLRGRGSAASGPICQSFGQLMTECKRVIEGQIPKSSIAFNFVSWCSFGFQQLRNKFVIHKQINVTLPVCYPINTYIRPVVLLKGLSL